MRRRAPEADREGRREGLRGQGNGPQGAASRLPGRHAGSHRRGAPFSGARGRSRGCPGRQPTLSLSPRQTRPFAGAARARRRRSRRRASLSRAATPIPPPRTHALPPRATRERAPRPPRPAGRRPPGPRRGGQRGRRPPRSERSVSGAPRGGREGGAGHGEARRPQGGGGDRAQGGSPRETGPGARQRLFLGAGGPRTRTGHRENPRGSHRHTRGRPRDARDADRPLQPTRHTASHAAARPRRRGPTRATLAGKGPRLIPPHRPGPARETRVPQEQKRDPLPQPRARRPDPCPRAAPTGRGSGRERARESRLGAERGSGRTSEAGRGRARVAPRASTSPRGAHQPARRDTRAGGPA